MIEQKILIKSRGRRLFKIFLVSFIATVFLTIGFFENDTIYFILSGVLGFVVFVELATYGQTTIELTDSQLKIKRVAMFKIINENYQIDLKNIQSTYYKKKTYDSWMLVMQNLIWELFFPSGIDYLMVNKTNGKTEEIPFNGNEEELLKLKRKLPERIPNI